MYFRKTSSVITTEKAVIGKGRELVCTSVTWLGKESAKHNSIN